MGVLHKNSLCVDHKVKLAVVWELWVWKSSGGRARRVVEFGCSGCSRCLILPALLLTVLSPGADSGLSIFMFLAAGMFSGMTYLRILLVSLCLLLWDSCAWSPCKAPSTKIQQDTVSDKPR